MFRLKTRITLMLLPLIMLPLIVAGLLLYHRQSENFLIQVNDQLVDQLNVAQANLQRRVDVAQGNLRLISKSNLIRQYFMTDDEEQRFFLFYRPVLELFRSYQEIFPEYIDMRILDADGKPQTSLPQAAFKDNADAITQAWINADKGQPEKEKTCVIRAVSGAPLLLVGASISLSTFTDWRTIDESDRAGSLVIASRLDDIAKNIQSTHIGKHGHVMLVDAAGTPYLQGDGEHPVSHSEVFDHLPPPSESREAVVIGEPGNYYLTLQREVLPDLRIVGVWPMSELKENAFYLANQVAWLTLVLIVITSALIFSVVHGQLIKPISRVTQLAQILGESHAETPPEAARDFQSTLRRRDEIGELARAFKNMDGNLRATASKLTFIAYHDSLTGLANRHTFGAFLHRAITEAARHNFRLGLLYIDIDGFKDVNDSLGHEAGDLVLKEISQRLHNVLRVEDLVADMSAQYEAMEATKMSRIGGDEFAIVVNHLQSPMDVSHIVKRLLDAMRAPFLIESHSFLLGASVGIAVYPEDGKDAHELLKCADIAMYHSKRQGRNGFEYFDKKMNQMAVERHQIISDIRSALQKGQFELYYQPQVSALAGNVMGCEALLRWRHPERGFVSPAEFIPIAEETGQIIEIGSWVLKEACRQCREWQAEGLDEIRMSVNISALQFGSATDIVAVTREALTQSGLNPDCLDLEITETAMMQSGKVGVDKLNALKNLGVSISMDDFGTGYSSLASLRDLPIDQLKIDKSFVDKINHDSQGRAIIKAILALAKELSIEVVAEGVEERTQLDFLSLHRCDLIQGYYVAKPLPADGMRDFLRQHTQVESSWRP
ncbi:EAL domain-containing protein [Hahella aquimaris]|uniref:bifunctional diguanylate cyclase/phosphodiesterase n=1 Tax=Hahella sp. HNIBRBA332 TaxID=3015983 RepID=UPI00273B8950|nr:EAL domain-containing protein [Hahella sp. HNIBRBA332]WLQ13420.1 EAL domain-containing protein [Hahella sp. HNIBRBA332]